MTGSSIPFVAISALIGLFSLPAHGAVTFSRSQTAPLVDGADIANLSQGTAFADFQTSIIWGDRPARGQSFTTGSELDGYWLFGVTVQSTGGQTANGSYTIRLGTISGTSFSVIATENTGSVTTDVLTDDFVTFAFSTPVVLNPNTLYGFDIGRSGSGWQLKNNANTEYPGGQAYTSGASGVGGATITNNPQDRIFHLDLVIIPEPSTAFLSVFGLLGLALRRRR